MLAKDKLDRPRDDDPTVDPKQIEWFSALAAEWWNPRGKFRQIHAFNPVRRDFIVHEISRHFGRSLEPTAAFRGLTILDVGCGAGLLCEPLAELGADVVGIDATARNIAIARHHAEGCGLFIDYRHCLVRQVVECGARFDVVLNTEVVEHVVDPQKLLQDCAALVKPDGILIVATLNRTLRAYALAIVGAEYLLGWLPKGTHDWRRFLRPAEVKSMIAGQGLTTTTVKGVVYNPLSGRWRLSGDDSVNYMLLAEKRRGSLTNSTPSVSRSRATGAI